LLKRYKSQRDEQVPKKKEMIILQRRGRVAREIEAKSLGKRKEGKNRLKTDIKIGKKIKIVNMKKENGMIEIEMIEVLKEKNKRNDEDQHHVGVHNPQKDVYLPTEKDQSKNKAKKSE